MRLAFVDEAGCFHPAAPGENFPYLINCAAATGWPGTLARSRRSSWKAGETTSYDMLVTPPVPEEEKLKEAQKVVDSLPKSPADRARGSSWSSGSAACRG